MSEQIDELVDNLKRPSLWKRVFFTLGFALLFNIILVPLVLLMVLVQVAFSLFAGEKNSNLADLSEKLVAYLVEVLGFLLFTTEHKPFPFNDFPGLGEINTSAEDVVESEISRSESAQVSESDERVSEEGEAERENEDTDKMRGPSATPQG
jgi:hypothetical protein|tara:strand:+ start:19177 stop:19629 length:453 start_codon:yes stop_codon:yes gene_type:complete